MALSDFKYGIKLLSSSQTIQQGTGGSPTSVTSVTQAQNVQGYLKPGLYLQVQGEHASANGIVSFYFQHSPDGVTWVNLSAIQVTMTGTTEVIQWQGLNLEGIMHLRLASVGNADATYDALVNAWLVRKPTDW